MIEPFCVRKEELEDRLVKLSAEIEEPIYRGLHGECKTEYLKRGIMTARSGSLSSGTGVFFTNSISYGISFMDDMIVIADLAKFRRLSRIVDTRINNYTPEFRDMARKSLGREPNGYEVWQALVDNFDAITNEDVEGKVFIYSRRVPVYRDELEYDVRLAS